MKNLEMIPLNQLPNFRSFRSFTFQRSMVQHDFLQLFSSGNVKHFWCINYRIQKKIPCYYVALSFSCFFQLKSGESLNSLKRRALNWTSEWVLNSCHPLEKNWKTTSTKSWVLPASFKRKSQPQLIIMGRSSAVSPVCRSAWMSQRSEW